MKKIIGLVILTLEISLIISVISSKFFGIDLKIANPADLPFALWLAGIFPTVLMVMIISMEVFKTSKLTSSAKNGFLLGLAASAIGLFFNFLAFVPHPGGINKLIDYFYRPEYWSAYILILTVCTLVGHIKSKKIKSRKS